MLIFKYLGYFLLSFVVYNYLLLELEKKGINKQELYNQIEYYISEIQKINVIEYAPTIGLTGLLLTLLC